MNTTTSPTVPADGAYQGEPGAYSECAAEALLGPHARLLPLPALEDVFASVGQRRARHAVVPLENTIAGTVPGVYELLLSHDLHVVAETRVAIDHVLIGPQGLTLDGVRRVLSHPVALGQCRDFLRRHPAMAPVAAFDTAGAVRHVLEQDDGVSAAIAGRHAAAVYGGIVLAEHLQDHPENWTRFGLLARGEPVPVEGATKVLMVFDLPHRPGALAGALSTAADAAVDLTKIESRPIATRPFEYRFIVELSHDDPGRLSHVIERMTSRTVNLRVIGRFRATTTEESER
jgi:prephenate dehydratase